MKTSTHLTKDVIQRMNGIVSQSLIEEFGQSIDRLHISLIDEGFEEHDVREYLSNWFNDHYVKINSQQSNRSFGKEMATIILSMIKCIPSPQYVHIPRDGSYVLNYEEDSHFIKWDMFEFDMPKLRENITVLIAEKGGGFLGIKFYYDTVAYTCDPETLRVRFNDESLNASDVMDIRTFTSIMFREIIEKIREQNPM